MDSKSYKSREFPWTIKDVEAEIERASTIAQISLADRSLIEALDEVRKQFERNLKLKIDAEKTKGKVQSSSRRKEAKKVNEVDCPYWKECFRFMQKYLEMEHNLEDNHICFCEDCHEKRGDDVNYVRGKPSKVYELPINHAGLAISLNSQTS